MRCLVIAIGLLFSIVTHSQEVMTIAGTIIDSETGDPIDFVNLGFIETGIGTVSNSEGNFRMSFYTKDVRKKRTLQISSIGYESITISFDELKTLESFKSIVLLIPSEIKLDEVVIASKKRQFERLGSVTYSKDEMGYWRNRSGLGGELATRIDIKKTNTKLHDLKFNILENESDSLLVRVNIYDYYRNAPGKNILTKKIYHTITKKKGVDTISLVEHNIIVHRDIVVSLELVQVYGDAIYLALSATPYGGTTFKRERSMAGWESYRGVGLAFSLLSSYSEEPSNFAANTRFSPSRITLYWDISLGMRNRNIAEELKLLRKYLSEISKVRDVVYVNVIKFSNEIVSTKEVIIKGGRTSRLMAYLQDNFYNGAVDYSSILKENDFMADIVLLFTNGVSIGAPITANTAIPIFGVNSLRDANHNNINTACLASGGHYINLAKLSAKVSLRSLLEDVNDLEDYSSISKADRDVKGLVHGIVYNNSGPIEGAFVHIKNSYHEARTDTNGMYIIDAGPGDELQVSAIGMRAKDTVVGVLKKLHINLKPDGELLREVVVVGKRTKETVVVTPFGKKNPDALGISLTKTVTSEDIKPFHTITQLITMGAAVDALDGKYRFRKFKYASISLSTFAAIVLDGVVYDQNIIGSKIPPINVQLIERITFLESAAGTIRYGSSAAYGAIVIETKQYPLEDQQEVPSLLVKNNDYNESLPMLEDEQSAFTKPDFLNELLATSNFEEAKESYASHLRGMNTPAVDYFIEAGMYFMKWDTSFASSVWSNIAEIAPENIKALKSLAYTYDSFGKEKKATEIYEQIVELAPGKAQSYLNLARNYKETGKYELSATLYKQMLFNSIPNVEFTEVAETVINELKHLLAHHKSSITYLDLPVEFLSVGFQQDIRIVVEWNDPMAEFELQFVNSSDKYFVHSHTVFNNREQILKEIKDGYSVKEFVINDADTGRWLINLRYLGPKDDINPTYLKYSIYKNYGLSNETKEVKVVKLQDLQGKVTLDRFLR